jgi:hypothetical protein
MSDTVHSPRLEADQRDKADRMSYITRVRTHWTNSRFKDGYRTDKGFCRS